MTPSHSRARGFTLIEALVALVVLSIGLLGIASLQLTSLRFNQSASMRSQSTLLAYDIIDRMRVNSKAAATGAYNVQYTKSLSGSTRAGKDVTTWKANIQKAFPAGDGEITSMVVGGVATYTIKIKWDDSRGAGAATEFLMRTQL